MSPEESDKDRLECQERAKLKNDKPKQSKSKEKFE